MKEVMQKVGEKYSGSNLAEKEMLNKTQINLQVVKPVNKPIVIKNDAQKIMQASPAPPVATPVAPQAKPAPPAAKPAPPAPKPVAVA